LVTGRSILRLGTNGVVVGEPVSVEASECAFFCAGDTLITPERAVLSCESGESLWDFIGGE
jgi:hypothetical protein